MVSVQVALDQQVIKKNRIILFFFLTIFLQNCVQDAIVLNFRLFEKYTALPKSRKEIILKKLKEIILVAIAFIIVALLGNSPLNNFNPLNFGHNTKDDYYFVAGSSELDPETFNKTSNYTYSEKDELGRSGQARATITSKDVFKSLGHRDQFEKDDNPSGFPEKNFTAKVQTTNGLYDGWFYNRSHLIADSLGGDAKSYNAITGTRMQNVGNRKNTGGMQYIERKCTEYLKKHRSVKLYYQVTPNYKDDEIIPRTVEVQALTSDGAINEKVITYNTAKGYTIDYKTGKVTKNK